MNRMFGLVLAAVAAVSMTGCGMMQQYHQSLDNNQRTFERHQAVMEAQNQVTIAQLQVQAAKQQAQVNIAIAKGKAEAQEIQTRSLKPLFVQQELVDAIHDGKVETIIVPGSGSLLNVTASGKTPSSDSSGGNSQ